MKRTGPPAEQIIRKLKAAEQLIAQGKTVAHVCRVIEVTQPTYHRWRSASSVIGFRHHAGPNCILLLT